MVLKLVLLLIIAFLFPYLDSLFTNKKYATNKNLVANNLRVILVKLKKKCSGTYLMAKKTN